MGTSEGTDVGFLEGCPEGCVVGFTDCKAIGCAVGGFVHAVIGAVYTTEKVKQDGKQVNTPFD